MRRVLPDPSVDITIEQAYAEPLGGPTDRPWCSLCMVASIDGSTVTEGRSAGLSSPNDAAVLGQLRRVADVILVGAGTVRTEGYGRPAKPGQRVGVVTASGRVDTTSELFRSGAGFVVTTERTCVPDGIDTLRAGVDHVHLVEVLRRLDEVVGPPRVVQFEGGASFNGSLLEADLVDEINVTTSPLGVGGTGPRLAVGMTERALRFELAQLVVDEESFVYARWRRHHAGRRT